eukprot:gene25395-27530_t
MPGLAATADGDEIALLEPATLAAANINPSTRLATDYLNHFNNIVMLLDLISVMPDCVGDVLDWRPLDYPSYFMVSHFKHKTLAIAAYQAADPAVRDRLERIVARLDTAVIAAQDVLQRSNPLDELASERLNALVARSMRPLITEASAVINGTGSAVRIEAETSGTQETIDELFP